MVPHLSSSLALYLDRLFSEYNSTLEKERLTEIMTYGEEGLPVIVKPKPLPPQPAVDRFDESKCNVQSLFILEFSNLFRYIAE